MPLKQHIQNLKRSVFRSHAAMTIAFRSDLCTINIYTDYIKHDGIHRLSLLMVQLYNSEIHLEPLYTNLKAIRHSPKIW